MANEFQTEEQKRNREQLAREVRGTMETYKIEKDSANNIPVPPIVVNILAVVGLIAIIYFVVTLIF